MLSEHIFFIIERISDISNVDNERNQNLPFCQDASNDEREAFLELYSDYKKREILESNSDDKIRKILEFYSDDKTKKILEWYLFDPMEEIQKLYSEDEILQFRAMPSNYGSESSESEDDHDLRSCYRSESSESDDDEREKFFLDDKILEMKKLYLNYQRERYKKYFEGYHVSNEFHDLYLQRYDRRELKKTYRELSDDDKLKFLHNYNDSWRSKILKYVEFRQRWFHNHNPQTLFEIITLLMEGKQYVLSNDVKQGIEELHKELSRIYNYLRDRQVLSEYKQQSYLNLSYIADSSDDFLDRVMSNHATALDIHTLLQTIRNFYNNLPSIQFSINVNAEGNINNGGTQNIANSSITINDSNPANHNNYPRPKTYGHVLNPDLVGFNHEIQLLLNHLIQSHHETHVVGIVGPGGSGKTTLAKHIYHHPQINSHFATKVWVCISQSWDKTTILNSIWRQASQNPTAPEMGYDQLVDCLSQLLRSKSYLVIVDDIWSVDAWYHISSALPPRSRSKVVVTTRNRFLPQHIDPGVLIVEPKQLNDKECYELFKKRALLDENVHPELKSLAVEMVKKCKGLPLAVVALAGVLGIDKSLSSWERIRKGVTDKMLNMANESTQGVVKDILAFSYYELPENLKPCTLYLRVFPEDYVIEAQQLIQMWMAECFVDEEDKAEEYLEQLAQRCIVEVVETNHKGQMLRFRVHDLIREMFINIYEERDTPKNQVLRLAPSATVFDNGQKNFDSPMKILDRDLYGNSHARSLIYFNFQFDQCVELLQQLSIKFKRLRVLIIDHVLELGLPEEIGNLIHLRYLLLSGTTNHLPGSIGNLENLLTLHLGYLYVEDRQIINLEKLKELRHLYMAPRNDFYENIEVKGVEKLKKLKTWRDVDIDKCMLSVMPNLSHVLQDLCIRRIGKEEELEVVFRTPSITSNNLRTLVLQWPWCEVGDMSMMSKCKSLTRLKLRGKIKKGTSLIFPPSLIHLEMIDTKVEEEQVMNIISNSCPLLKILILEYEASMSYWMAYKMELLVCNENSFPKLEKLQLSIPDGLKSWIIGRGAMQRLNHLDIFVPYSLRSELIGRLEVNDEARELISKLAPSFIPYLTLPRRSSKRKTMDLFPDL